MRGKIGCLSVVEERVQRCESGVGEKSSEQCFVWMVEA